MSRRVDMLVSGGVGAALAVGATLAVEHWPRGAAEYCHSNPAAVSERYPGDPKAKADHSTWKLGVLATTRNLPDPRSYEGLAVGFRAPNQLETEVTLSLAVPPERAESI